MSLTKYAEFKVLSVESASGDLLSGERTSAVANPFVKQAHRHQFEYDRRPGYIYVRSRAISSRTNDNHDEFPAEEIKAAYRTFIGKPVFVNHHNSNHRRARGVIIDAALHEDVNPDGTPDTWAEVLMEVDAVRFPRLAEAVIAGDVARTSMGTDVAYSVCTACGNKAATPAEYCQHIPRMKGMKIRRVLASGQTEEVLIAERCYGLRFFENSLLVEPPADPTAFVLGVDGFGMTAAHKVASIVDEQPVGPAAPSSLRVASRATRPGPDWDAMDQMLSAARLASVVEAATFKDGDRLDSGKGLRKGDKLWWKHDAIGAGHATDVEVDSDYDEKSGTVKIRNKRVNYTRTISDDEISRGRHTIKRRVEPRNNPALTRKSSLQVHADGFGTHLCPACNERISDSVWVCPIPACGACQSCGVELHGDDFFEHWRQVHPHAASLSTTAYGETKAPAKVDTLRADRCPVCKDDEAFNGEKCSVCGHVEPPAAFRDPDLTKAQEMDLRQEQAEEAGAVDPTIDPAAVEETSGPEGDPDLECTNCGEVFSAEGESAPDPEPEQASQTEIDPKHPDDPEDGVGEKADDADDLSDLADLDDEALDEALDDEDDEEDEPEEDASETASDSGLSDIEPGPNMTCPICGQGTLLPREAAPEQPTSEGQAVGEDSTMNQPNPAKQARNAIIAALQEQQATIQTQAQRIDVLTRAVREIVTAAGVQNNPRFASLMATAEDHSIDTTTEQARQPDSKDDPEKAGSTGGEANNGVTPDAVTDVQNSNVAIPQSGINMLVDVTSETPGTDNPAAQEFGKGDINVGTPSTDVQDPAGTSGWKSSSVTTRGEERERFTASLRLARLQISTGLESGEDLTIAQAIFDGGESLEAITTQAVTLDRIRAASRLAPNQLGQQHRHLVPQAARTAAVRPSLQSAPAAAHTAAVSGRPGDDEFMFGTD